MNLVWGIVIGIIALTILVVLHELGHALVARRNGVRVEEFGIGFPPAAYKKNVKKSFLGKAIPQYEFCRYQRKCKYPPPKNRRWLGRCYPVFIGGN